MSSDKPFTKKNLDDNLKALAKEFRRLNGKVMPAEITLIGGASILINYGFREMTYDVDAIITATSVMKDAINSVGDELGLPSGWLNTDFTRTKSYTAKLHEISVYHKTYSGILTIRTVAAEYLIAMKLMSGRQYKNDLSDIVGILWEHEKSGDAISREAIEKAVSILYEDWAKIPKNSRVFIDAVFENGDFESLYLETKEAEIQSRDILVKFEEDFSNVVTNDNIDEILEQLRQRK
jgi:predicted nucleotidyltransferase